MQNGFQNKYYPCHRFLEIIECDSQAQIITNHELPTELTTVLIMFCKIDRIYNLNDNITKLTIIGCEIEEIVFIENMNNLVTLDVSSNNISKFPKIPKTLKSLNIANNQITDFDEIIGTELVCFNVSANPTWNVYGFLELNVLQLVLFDPTYTLTITKDKDRQDIRVFLMKMNENIKQIDQYHKFENSGDLEIDKFVISRYLRGGIHLFELLMTAYYGNAISTTINYENNEISMKLEHRLWVLYSTRLLVELTSVPLHLSAAIHFPFDLLQITEKDPIGPTRIVATKISKLNATVVLVDQILIKNVSTDIYLTAAGQCTLQLSTNKIEALAHDFFEIVYLDISNQNLTELPPGLEKIKFLVAKNNRLTDIPKYQTLVLLDLSDNKISKFSQIIELAHLQHLKYLDIRCNLLKLCDIFGKTILHHLVHYNGKYLHEYKDIDLTTLTIEACHVLFPISFDNITTLQLPFNNMKNINFEFAKYFLFLSAVDFSNNTLKNVDFLINNTTITSLILSGNVLESFNVVIDSLLILDLSFNSLRDMLLIEAQPNLTKLDLERNKISKLQFKDEFTNLVELKLSRNTISQISNIWSLAPKLSILLLDDNKLSVLNPLSSNLTLLNVSNNSLQDLNELYNLELPECVQLDIKGNSLCRFKVFTDYIYHSCPKIKFINGRSVVQLKE